MSRADRAAAAAVLLGCALAAPARAELFSRISDSSVVGRNTGYPSGTPSQGRTPVGAVELVPEVAVFLENIEKLSTVQGRTFMGFLAPLRLRYRAHERLSVELGALLGHDFGDDSELDHAEPIVRLVAEPAESVYLVAGTILPTHWMHDALLDDVHRLQAAEQGLQFRADRQALKLDAWLNWRVRETSLRPEEFELALAGQLRPWRGLHVDGQMLWAHVGGQRNTSDRVEHNLGLLAGASYGFAAVDATWLEELRFGGRALYGLDDTRQTASQSGHGWEAFVRLDLRPWESAGVRVHGSYFDGNDFAAHRGDPLYGLSDYAQAGVSLLFDLPGDLRLEAGVILQVAESQFNGSFLVNFVWGRAFGVPVLRAREPADPTRG